MQSTAASASGSSKGKRATGRNNITVACDSCRRRRCRCDGQRPACQACRSRGITNCVYSSVADNRKPYTKDVVTALQARIDALEESNVALRLQVAELTASSMASGRSTPLEDLRNRNGLEHHSQTFLGLIGRPTNEGVRFYGPTSIDVTSPDMDERVFRPIQEESLASVTSGTKSLSESLGPPLIPISLDRSALDHILELSFRYVVPWTYYVADGPFRASIRQNCFSVRTHHYSPFLLLTLLAVGSRYLAPDSPYFSDQGVYSKRGDIFAGAAKKLVESEIERPMLSTISGLFLLGHYLVGRGGQDYYTGRPPFIRLNQVDQSYPVIDADIDSAEPFYRSTALLHLVRLSAIGSRIINSVYGLDKSNQTRENATKLRVELAEWYRTLPGYIKTSSHCDYSLLSPHILCLNQLYFTTLILLYRPHLNSIVSQDPSDASRELCKSAAFSVLHLAESQAKYFGVGTATLTMHHNLFIAGTVFLLLSVNADDDSSSHSASGDYSPEQACRRCISFLRDFGQIWPGTLSTASRLEILLNEWCPINNGNATRQEAGIDQGGTIILEKDAETDSTFDPPFGTEPAFNEDKVSLSTHGSLLDADRSLEFPPFFPASNCSPFDADVMSAFDMYSF